MRSTTHRRAPSRLLGLLTAATLPLFMWTAGSASAAGLLTPVGSSSPLAIESQHVNVLLEDGYATTTIEQTFHNSGTSDTEAIYAFPVPDKAAVGSFTYWIDGKPVSAEVVPKEKARELYESEKAANHETALAEQDDYRRFEMSVWPVRSNGDVRIRLTYVQTAKLDAGIGRYVYPMEEGGTDDPAVASFWKMKDEVNGQFSFDMTLRPSYPIEALRLPGHPEATVSQDASGAWHATFASGATKNEEQGGAATPTSKVALDRDVVVYWRQTPGLPGALDVLPYKASADGRGTFMAVLTPGEDTAVITGGRDWTFIIDKSGSMDAKFATLMEGIGRTLASLPAQDRFRIITFNDSASSLFNGYRAATPENIQQTISDLSQISAGGSTNLYAGFSAGLSHLDDDRPSGVVLITDGVANVGPHERKDFVKLIGSQDVRLFTVIMGNSANQPLLEHLAAYSGGTSMSISNSDDIAGRLMTATSRLSHYAVTDISVSVDGIKTADITPELKGGLYHGQQLVIFGHYWGAGAATVHVSGKINGKPITYDAPINMPDVATSFPDIERLWAFSRIEDEMRQNAVLDQADKDSKQAITDTAVEFGLLTPYTSMIVLRDEVFAQKGIERSNDRRTKLEADARTQRASTPPSFPSAQLASSGPRPHISTSGGGSSSGGSGAAGPALLLMLGLYRLARHFGRGKADGELA